MSVVLCTYDGARFIREQIESILRQTRLADEIVVRDDHSSDGTVDIIREYESVAPIRLTVNESNLGSTENFARGIADAHGEIIALSDQDDVWEPTKLERVVRVLDSGNDLVFSDAELIDEHGALLGRRLWDSIGFRGAVAKRFPVEPLSVLGRGKNVVTGATMAFRSELRRFILPIPPEWTQDGWIAIVAAVFGRLETISDPLIRYRIHRRQQLGLTAPVSRVSRDLPLLGRQLRQFRSALERSRPCGDPRRYAVIEETVAHLEARSALPASRVARFPAIAREIATGRYFRCSRGLLSALKDLVAL